MLEEECHSTVLKCDWYLLLAVEYSVESDIWKKDDWIINSLIFHTPTIYDLRTLRSINFLSLGKYWSWMLFDLTYNSVLVSDESCAVPSRLTILFMEETVRKKNNQFDIVCFLLVFFLYLCIWMYLWVHCTNIEHWYFLEH